MDRTIPYDENAICDDCGHKGAYDFMGDFLCDECTAKAFDDCACGEDCGCTKTDEEK